VSSRLAGIVARCLACQRENPEGARFCLECGAPFSTEPASEVRKVVSIVFVDLVGFTSMTERLDVEDVRALLVPYHTLVRRQLERYGGLVEKFIGDAVVAIFGAPVAHEDDAERAVRAALAIRDAVLADDPRDGPNLHVRIGITTGEALVDLRARTSAGEPTVAGDVVNTASRLQAAAPTNGILVNQATQRLTVDQIVYRDAGDQPVRGKAAPVTVWEAVRARSRRGEDVSRQHSTPLVDRQSDRAALIAALERARDHRRLELVTIAGAAGIGKSRLVRELFDYVEDLPEFLYWRQGRTLAYDASTFAALADMVKAHIGALDTDTPDEAEAKLQRAVEKAVRDEAERAWICQQLRPLVGLEAAGEVRGDRRAEAFGAWRRFLEAIAEERPLVLVFEDLHWADDDLLAFIEHLLAWVVDVPMLIVCTMRFELLDRRPAWVTGREHTALLVLRPLTGAEIDELLRALLGGGLPPAGTGAALVEYAEGNPLFAHEYVRMLIDQGRLVHTPDGWRLEDGADLATPQSLVAIIAARLDTLPPEEKTIVQDAAVVGRRVWAGAVAAVAGRGEWAVAEVLHGLEQRELLRRVGDTRVRGQVEYVFQHALIRDVAYGQIVRSERAEKHRRAARWIESLRGGRHDHAETLVHHYVTALDCAVAAGQEVDDLRALACGALLEAAERAFAVHSYPAAAGLAARGLELCLAGALERPRLMLTHGLALAMANRPAVEALEHAYQSLLEAGDRQRAAEAQSTIGWLHATAGHLQRASTADDRALELCRDLAPSRAKALVLVNAASHLVFKPEHRAHGLNLLAECLDVTRELRLAELEAEALEFRGLARLDAGEAGGLADLEQAADTAARAGSSSTLSCYGNLTDVRRRLGQLAAASELQERGLRMATRFGMPTPARRFTVERIVSWYYAGRWQEALALADEYLGGIEAGSPHFGEVDARITRARIRSACGDRDGAARDAGAALAYGRQNGEGFDLLPALAAHAGVVWGHSQAEAEASARELVDRLRSAQIMWAAWTLPDVLPAVAELGLADELARLLGGASPRTEWYEGAEAFLADDHAGSAAVYARIGSRPDEADAHLRGARRTRDGAALHELERNLAAAAAFYRSVGAHARLREVEAVTSPTRS
jgi:class 3 adenylate cyclase